MKHNQKFATGVKAVVAAVAAAVVCLGWVVFVFPTVGVLTTGSESWHHVLVSQAPFWGPFLQIAALVGAAVTSFVVAVVVSDRAENAVVRSC